MLRTPVKFLTLLIITRSLLAAVIAFAEDAPEPRITVEAVAVSRQPIVELVPVNGTLTPPRQAIVSTEVEGLVSKMYVDVGNRVEAGQALLELDPELNAIARDAALADVERSREALADSRRRLREAQALVGDNYIAETEVLALSSEVRIREAELRTAEIEAKRQEALLRRHRIVAPFPGTVSQKLAELGEWVEPGVELFELVDAQQLKADLEVPQRYFGRIREDTRISVQLSGDDTRTYKARVLHKVPLSRSGARTFVLRTVIEGKDVPQMIAGMSVSANLHLGTERRAIAIPRDAVLRYPDGRVTVWVAAPGSQWNQSAKVNEVQVATGLSFNGRLEITRGLKPGEIVITRGNESLQPGQSVILKKAQ